ncbi:MAG TPA: lysoplasmalogenase [Trinickia sp.]|jgi:uncharacterized membrane protein YhhN|nr:lysoplasmalogenase [Trinickia sp.]
MPTPSPAENAHVEAASQSRRLWLVAGGAALAYGISLRGAPYPDQAAAKVLMCGLLVLAAARHEPARERARLCAALVASGVGDVLLALPQLSFSFIGGLGAFLLAHLAYCALFAPLAGAPRGWRRVALPLVWAAALAMYGVFFPRLGALAAPVAVYMLALCAMASMALAARLPGSTVAFGGLAFVASDAMIGIDRFVGPFAGSAYAIWFSYAIAQLLLAGGILLTRRAAPVTPRAAQNEE